MGLGPGFLNAWWSQFWQMKHYSRGCSGEVFCSVTAHFVSSGHKKGNHKWKGLLMGNAILFS